MPDPRTDKSRLTRDPVIEIDGMFWKPRKGATSSAAEFSTARATMIEIHLDARWNPWVEQDRADELEQAMATFEQWTRAEPGYRVKTEAEVDAMLAEWDLTWQAQRDARDVARAARKTQYEDSRESARLRLLECWPPRSMRT